MCRHVAKSLSAPVLVEVCLFHPSLSFLMQQKARNESCSQQLNRPPRLQSSRGDYRYDLHAPHALQQPRNQLLLGKTLIGAHLLKGPLILQPLQYPILPRPRSPLPLGKTLIGAALLKGPLLLQPFQCPLLPQPLQCQRPQSQLPIGKTLTKQAAPLLIGTTLMQLKGPRLLPLLGQLELLGLLDLLFHSGKGLLLASFR